MSSPSPISGQLRTELFAVRTVRAPWFLAAATIAVSLLLAVTSVLDAGKAAAPSIGTAGAMLALLDSMARGSVVVFLIGVLTVTSEFRYGTVTLTFLQTPNRLRVLTSKAIAVIFLGAALAVVNLVVVLGVGSPSGAFQLSIWNSDIGLHVLGLLFAYPVYGVLGVGIGALLVYQPVAVALPLAWLLAEHAFGDSLPDALQPWSLTAVTAAAANSVSLEPVLPVLAGTVALVGYAAVVLSLGAIRVLRRDIT
jgi:ABC-2 type transport system permease protein